jgi:putative heme transporter
VTASEPPEPPEPLEPLELPAAATAEPDGDAPEEPQHRPWWHLALRIVAVLVVLAVVIAVLRDNIPKPSEIGRALDKANWWWIAAALALQLASVGMMVRQQRRLLHAFGVPIRYPRMMAITYSSTALSMSMPAGGAVGAGWSYKQYRNSGASAATAATVLLLSGVLSVVALVLLYLGGLALAAGSRLLNLGEEDPLLAGIVGLCGLAVVSAVAWLLGRGAKAIPVTTGKSTKFLDWQHRHARLGPAVGGILSTGRRARKVRVKDWRLALLTSVANWGLDAGCLYLSCLAVGIKIELVPLGLIYLGIQLVRQIPITPGGVGVVEASLLAALVAAGAANGPGSAAVLIYRLLSAWLLVPIGYGMMWLLRRRRTDAPPRRRHWFGRGPVATVEAADAAQTR